MKCIFYIVDQNNVLHACKISAKRNCTIFKTFYNNNCTEQIQSNHIVFTVIPHQLTYFFYNIDHSLIYKLMFIKYVYSFKPSSVLLLKIIPPAREFIDYKWCEMAQHSAYEKMELDHLLSWLSTLGGGYSALGDSMNDCAEVAGKISIYQFKLALRFGDPTLVARSKLYVAIAQIQINQLRRAKHLIKEQYKFATTEIESDERLVKMCLGIWAKLQHAYTLRKQRKNLIKTT